MLIVPINLATYLKDFNTTYFSFSVIFTCYHDANIRKQGSVLLFILLLHPLTTFASKQQLDDFENNKRLISEVQALGLDSQRTTQEFENEILQSTSNDNFDIIPKLPELFSNKLHVPYCCSKYYPRDVVRELVCLQRTCVQAILPLELTNPKNSYDGGGIFSPREASLLTKEFDDACGNTKKVSELLRQEGGCAEQIHALLKMVWASSAAGSPSNVREDVDYSSQFSDFVSLSNREKILYRCSLTELFAKSVLLEIENCTSVKDAKHSVCLLENIVTGYVHSLRLLTEGCTASPIPTNLAGHFLYSDCWWQVLGKFLKKEPDSVGEQQVYSHVVQVLCQVVRGCLLVAPLSCNKSSSVFHGITSLLLSSESAVFATLAHAGMYMAFLSYLSSIIAIIKAFILY